MMGLEYEDILIEEKSLIEVGLLCVLKWLVNLFSVEYIGIREMVDRLSGESRNNIKKLETLYDDFMILNNKSFEWVKYWDRIEGFLDFEEKEFWVGQGESQEEIKIMIKRTSM
jgi:hypothetical protein